LTTGFSATFLTGAALGAFFSFLGFSAFFYTFSGLAAALLGVFLFWPTNFSEFEWLASAAAACLSL
jgi:uncharacterized membrane protein YgaE (UPF0421/DUF939 family)